MIEINNLTTTLIDKEFLKKVCQKVLKIENKKDFDLSIALVGEVRIRELNRKYKKKDKITDVLSFQYNNSGEIVICLKKIKENAKEFKVSFRYELVRILIHGILHTLGYNHEKSKKEAEKMREKEENYLEKLQITNNK